jgi:hypothetical protein
MRVSREAATNARSAHEPNAKKNGPADVLQNVAAQSNTKPIVSMK